jgi:hypothetical protein
MFKGIFIMLYYKLCLFRFLIEPKDEGLDGLKVVARLSEVFGEGARFWGAVVGRETFRIMSSLGFFLLVLLLMPWTFKAFLSFGWSFSISPLAALIASLTSLLSFLFKLVERILVLSSGSGLIPLAKLNFE